MCFGDFILFFTGEPVVVAGVKEGNQFSFFFFFFRTARVLWCLIFQIPDTGLLTFCFLEGADRTLRNVLVTQ